MQIIKQALHDLTSSAAEESEAEKIAKAHGLEISRVQEGIEVREMIKKMPKKVDVGSKWVVLPMAWVKLWQDYIYFDYVMGTPSGNEPTDEMPGQIDFRELIKPVRLFLADQTKD